MRVACLTAVMPILIPCFWMLCFITGPVSIGLLVYGWNKPGSLVKGRQRWMGVVGFLFALAQIALMGVMGWSMIQSFSHAR